MAPFGVFQAKDGHVAICAHTDELCRGVFEAMGQPDLMKDSRFALKSVRLTNSSDLNQIIEAWTRIRTVAEIVDRLGTHEVPCSKVNSPEASLVDPHVIYRKAVVPLPHPTVDNPEKTMGAGMPIKFSETSCDYDVPAPFLGQHNGEIYEQLLGLSAEEISALKSAGTI
jgi:CoA:oxalate CoA-transferase